MNRLQLSYVCISETEVINKFDNNVYDIYLKLSKENFEYKNKIKKLNEKIERMVSIDKKNYQKIADFLNQLDNIE